MKRIHVLNLLCLLLLSGCTAIGPSSIARDRFEYSTAVAESWKEMMLLNIVKLRYGDTPIFMEIGSIVNQYTLERQLEAEATLRSGDLVGDGLTLGGSGKYSDRPTITYSPLMGEKFSKSLLTPIPPHALFMLVQSGWNADFLLRICLSAINNMHNSSGRSMAMRHVDDAFEQLLDHLSAIQHAGGLGARMIERDGKHSIIYFRHDLDEQVEQHIEAAVKLLDLDPEQDEFSLVYGSTASSDTEIAMLTRSMLDIIAELAQYVEIPRQHVEENRASPGIIEKMGTSSEMRSRVLIKSSKEEPADAFIAVRYRDIWFYIEDTDFRSKRTFSFLLFLFSLAESGSKVITPILTLPTG